MSVKVSVILPVYNVSEYLRQCMDSIVGQTCKGHRDYLRR